MVTVPFFLRDVGRSVGLTWLWLGRVGRFQAAVMRFSRCWPGETEWGLMN